MTRVFWLCASVGCFALGIFCFGGLAGELYRQVGRAETRHLPSSAVAARAFELAGRLSPWTHGVWRERARSAGARGDWAGMLRLDRQALRWAPGNARLWMNHLQLLVHSGNLDAELTNTLNRTQLLAPASMDIHLTKMLLGIEHWRFAPEVLRRDTVNSARFVLQNTPAKFYRTLLLHRLDFLACTFVNTELGLDPWCQGIAPARSRCDEPLRDPRAIRWCENQGLRP